MHCELLSFVVCFTSTMTVNCSRCGHLDLIFTNTIWPILRNEIFPLTLIVTQLKLQSPVSGCLAVVYWIGVLTEIDLIEVWCG